MISYVLCRNLLVNRNDEGKRVGNVRKGEKVSIVVDIARCLSRGQDITPKDSELPLDAPFIANGEVVMVSSTIS